MSQPQLTSEDYQVLSTCAGFVRGMLGLNSYPWAEDVFHDLDDRDVSVALRCCNGGGKTTTVAAPAALWNASVFPGSLTVCTAGVHRQVAKQLFPALHSHKRKFSGWVWNESEIISDLGSRIIGFATDDSELAEGWHNENLLVIVDEAKSVGDNIFAAIDRCQPTRILMMSSPGGCTGVFYNAFHSQRRFHRCHKVTAADCPHISRAWINKQIEKHGEGSELVKSMINAEFMQSGDTTEVIPLHFIERCISEPQEFEDDGDVQAFSDFAAGGDENVLAVRRGNRVEIVKAWRERDTMKAIGQFIILFKEQGLTADQIFGDEGGLGRVVLDRMAEQGWHLNRVNNGEPALEPDAYVNISAECWYEGRNKIERQQIILPNDPILIGQLSSRRGGVHSSGRLMVEPKDVMKARGLPSPDRAEAVLGTMKRFCSPIFLA